MSSRESNRAYYRRNRKAEKARTKKWREENQDWYKRWVKKNRKKLQAANRLYEYGLTHKQFQRLLKKQKGICPICLRKMKRIDVDHCHKSKKIRGLLCHRCNTMLGFACDSIALLKRAINYLKRTVHGKSAKAAKSVESLGRETRFKDYAGNN